MELMQRKLFQIIYRSNNYACCFYFIEQLSAEDKEKKKDATKDKEKKDEKGDNKSTPKPDVRHLPAFISICRGGGSPHGLIHATRFNSSWFIFTLASIVNSGYK